VGGKDTVAAMKKWFSFPFMNAGLGDGADARAEAEAAARINQLLPCFGQWIATRQMSNI
jgi:hypothetical protein